MRLTEKKMLHIAAIAGIVSFILYVTAFLLPQTVVYAHATPASVFIDLLGLVAFCTYTYGFAVIGSKFSKPLITKAAYAVIITNIIVSVAAYMYPAAGSGPIDDVMSSGPDLLISVIGLAVTAAVIVLGWSFLELKSQLGWLAVWYGCLELVTGTGVVFLLSTPIGFSVDFVLYILGINILLLVASGRHEKNSLMALSKKPYFLVSVAALVGVIYFTFVGIMPPNGCMPFNPDDPACQGQSGPSIEEYLDA
jgi:hypothetical protein